MPPLPRERRTPETRPRTSRRMWGDAMRRALRTQGAEIANGVQQFGKGIADGLKQLPEIKLTKFGWGKK